MTGNDRFHVACGLQPSLLFVWRVLLCCQVPLPLWTDVSGLLGPHQAGRQASRRQQRKRVEEWWSDRGDELLAKHPGARPGPLPNREKTSRTHLCGDRDLSLHLKAKQHPIVICLNNHVHRTDLKTIFFSPKCSLLHPTVHVDNNTFLILRPPFFSARRVECNITQVFLFTHKCALPPQSNYLNCKYLVAHHLSVKYFLRLWYWKNVDL